MKETSVIICLNSMPLVQVADQVCVLRPFLHADRTAEFHVLIYVIRGCISVIEEDEEYQISAGRLLLLKAGIRHYGVTYSEPDTEWIYVHFLLEQPALTATEFQPYKTHLQEQEFSGRDYAYALELPKLLKTQGEGKLEGKLHRLVELFHSSNPLRAGYMNPLLQEILLDCYMLMRDELRFRNEDKVYAIIQYLESHTRESFDAERIEENFHLSYKHLGRLFKTATGRTLSEYHTELRMNEAARLLRETADTVTDISRSMGYADSFYFSNVFRKRMGIYPKFYRQQYMRRRRGTENEMD
ncbi:MAG: AraC family transcriptional regulator [Lachnospiraceae bacterium]